MLVRNGCKVVVSSALTAAAITVGSAQTARSNSINEALTFNGDGAQRSNRIHWPDGFHPEQADLFAHNDPRRTRHRYPGSPVGFLFSRHGRGTSILTSLRRRRPRNPEQLFRFPLQ
jgi:hypothetical protein